MCKSRKNIKCQLLENYILNKKDGIKLSDIQETLPKFAGVLLSEGRPRSSGPLLNRKKIKYYL